MLNPELLELLVCPESKQALRMADSETLARLNRAIQGASVRNQGGERVKEPIGEALVREDGTLLYPVVDDIPVMLLDEAIRLDTLP